jgi:hypothetical protein
VLHTGILATLQHMEADQANENTSGNAKRGQRNAEHGKDELAGGAEYDDDQRAGE